MPLYEYVCPACEARVEAIRRVADRQDGPACEGCGAETALALSAPGRVGVSGGGGPAYAPPPPGAGGCGPGGCGVGFN